MYIKNSKGSSKTILLGDHNINNANNCIEATIVKLVVDKLMAKSLGQVSSVSFDRAGIIKKNVLLEIAELVLH